jgi:hypothetical protein
MMLSTVAVLLPLVASAALLNDPANPVQFRIGTEVGFVKVLTNQIQLGRDGTMFDYVKNGGESNLYRFSRLTAEISINKRHDIIFLVQPLDVTTQALLSQPLRVDSLTFPAETPVTLRYGFDFYRASYLYNLLNDPAKELSIGASLQFRDAAISFASQDGQSFRIDQNVGPVPALKARLFWPFGRQSFIGAEVDGLYATSKFINGANFSFEGSILDASLRYGLRFSDAVTGFINLRYLGGNAKGQGYKGPDHSDGYTDNSLGTASVTVGCYLR